MTRNEMLLKIGREAVIKWRCDEEYRRIYRVYMRRNPYADQRSRASKAWQKRKEDAIEVLEKGKKAVDAMRGYIFMFTHEGFKP